MCFFLVFRVDVHRTEMSLTPETVSEVCSSDFLTFVYSYLAVSSQYFG